MPSYGCEQKCDYTELNNPTKLIVFTGGPGAGKTATLEYMRKILCEHVAILPEAASILFGGGFWRLKSFLATKAEQIAIYHVQNQIQNLVIGEKRWTLGLCDRGTLDGLAFWPDSEEDFYQTIHSSRDLEYTKYLAVIHLHSPNAQMGYNHQNPIRTESAEEAAKIDQKINEAWKAHPDYHVIDNTKSFSEKISHASELIQTYIRRYCKGHVQKT